jgi:hypothetical protein
MWRVGLGIAAHRSRPGAKLAWTDWAAPLDRNRVDDADSEWRDESPFALGRALLGYLIRTCQVALASLLERPVSTLAKWDQLRRHERRVIALAP